MGIYDVGLAIDAAIKMLSLASSILYLAERLHGLFVKFKQDH